MGLFAGLNVLPKKSYATAYSYRTSRDNQRALLAGWVRALSGLLFAQPEAFALDFHAIPYRGDDAGLDRHYIPRQGKAGTSVLTFFALEHDSRVLCYANANLTRAAQPGEPLRFVEFWHELTGSDPQWLYIDSKVMTYPELSALNQRGIWFVTIRRRGAAILRRLRQLPASVWQRAVIDTPKRCHWHIRYVWLGKQLRGFDKAAPKQVFRRFVETAGLVEVEEDRVVVRFDRHSHNPVRREAELDRDCLAVPWLGNRHVSFVYP